MPGLTIDPLPPAGEGALRRQGGRGDRDLSGYGAPLSRPSPAKGRGMSLREIDL